MDHLLKLIISR